MRLLAASVAALAFVVYVSGCCCCGPGIPTTSNGGTTVAAPSPAFGSALPNLAPTHAVVASASHSQQF